MKVLTLHQPWASLISLGVKTIETRSWPAPASVVGQRIAIHAAKTSTPWRDLDEPSFMDQRATITAVLHAIGVMEDDGRRWPTPYVTGDAIHIGNVTLPLGTIVATAVLTDCVPMVPVNSWEHNGRQRIFVGREDNGRRDNLWRTNPGIGPAIDITAQRPFGNFAPGRWAWLLDDIQALDEPVSFRGGQGLTREWNP